MKHLKNCKKAQEKRRQELEESCPACSKEKELRSELLLDFWFSVVFSAIIIAGLVIMSIEVLKGKSEVLAPLLLLCFLFGVLVSGFANGIHKTEKRLEELE